MVSLVVLWSTFILNSLIISGVYANSDEGDALAAFRENLTVTSDDPGVLDSWDKTLVNPCTWFHVTCNTDNSVTRVDLPGIGLLGPLVNDLANLKNLEYLELYNNNLLGEIPEEFGSLSNLRSLDLYTNGLMGEIPNSLALLTNLKFIRLFDNALSGTIFDFPRLPILAVLDLSSNNINGTLPELPPNSLTQLTTINLSNNQLSGVVPTSWNDFIDRIETVDLTKNNGLSGRCTAKLCNLGKEV